MSAASAVLSAPSVADLFATRGKSRRPPRGRGHAVAPVAGRPSSFANARGFSEDNKSGAVVVEKPAAAVVQEPAEAVVKESARTAEDELPPIDKVDEVVRPGQGVSFEAPPTPISGKGALQGSKWMTFYTEDENRTPYYFNTETGETKWCVLRCTSIGRLAKVRTLRLTPFPSSSTSAGRSPSAGGPEGGGTIRSKSFTATGSFMIDQGLDFVNKTNPLLAVTVLVWNSIHLCQSP